VRLPLDVQTQISVPDIIYRSNPVTVSCAVHNRDSRPACLKLSADLRDVGSDPGTAGSAGLRLIELILVCSADRPTVSGNPLIRIGEQESSVAIKNYQLEIIQPGKSLDVILHITSHGIATQLLAVALQETGLDNADSPKPNYIGISSTNLAFVEPLEIDYDSWITNAPGSTADPLDNPGTGQQVAVAWDLRMLGEQSIEVLGITYRHTNMVSDDNRWLITVGTLTVKPSCSTFC